MYWNRSEYETAILPPPWAKLGEEDVPPLLEEATAYRMGSTQNYYIVNFVNVNIFRQLTASGKDAKFIVQLECRGFN